MDLKVVMIVEDNADTRALYQRIFKGEEDFKVEILGSGHEALKRLETSPKPSLILTDLMLPSMSGEEFISAVRAKPEWSKIKIIVISGRDDLRSHSKAVGADGCIRKPFDLTSLYSEIERQLA